MSTDPFANAAENFEKSQGASEPASQEQTRQSENQAPSTQQTQVDARRETAQAIAELDKMDKFKLDGQEWTLKDLKAAIMRQKDYTQKTQSLSEDRKTFDGSKKFYENLAWDLLAVKNDPSRVQEFIKLYPKEFHQHVEKFLGAGANNQQQTQQQNVQQQPRPDVQLLSRLDTLEKFYNEQQVSKSEAEINTQMERLSKVYPDAANFKEMVLGRAFEAHSQGTQLTPEAWESIYKQVNQEVGTTLKAKYGELVKKQTEANNKSADVGAGGGSPGRAPMKFKKFDDITKYAEELSKSGG